jgi:hypothetical protein
MYAALRAARLQKNPVSAIAFMDFFSATFLWLLELLRSSFIATAKTSYTTLTLCAMLAKYV